MVFEASQDTESVCVHTPLRRLDTVNVKKIPDGLKNAIGDFLRAAADDANVSAIVEVK